MRDDEDLARHRAAGSDVDRQGFALHHAPGGVLVLTGRLDVVVSTDLRLALAAAVDDGHADLVLDVSGLAGVDASGLGVLVGAHRRAGRAGRRLVLRDVPPPLARVLRLTRLDRVLATTRTAALL